MAARIFQIPVYDSDNFYKKLEPDRSNPEDTTTYQKSLIITRYTFPQSLIKGQCYHIKCNNLHFRDYGKGDYRIHLGSNKKMIIDQKYMNLGLNKLDIYFIAEESSRYIEFVRVVTNDMLKDEVTLDEIEGDIEFTQLKNYIDGDPIDKLQIETIREESEDKLCFILDGEEIIVYDNDFYELHDDIVISNINIKRNIDQEPEGKVIAYLNVSRS